MMTRDGGKNRDQIEFTSLDGLVPEDHLVRKLENAIDWSFIYEMVEDSYCDRIPFSGCPSRGCLYAFLFSRPVNGSTNSFRLI